MSNLQILNVTKELIEKHFDADLVAYNKNIAIETKDNLKRLLTSMVSNLLDNNLEQLLRAMYRIDIDENKFHQILTFSPSDSVAETLAEEILNREEKKAVFRMKYQ